MLLVYVGVFSGTDVLTKRFPGQVLVFRTLHFVPGCQLIKKICSNQFYPCMFVCLFFYELIS